MRVLFSVLAEVSTAFDTALAAAPGSLKTYFLHTAAAAAATDVAREYPKTHISVTSAEPFTEKTEVLRDIHAAVALYQELDGGGRYVIASFMPMDLAVAEPEEYVWLPLGLGVERIEVTKHYGEALRILRIERPVDPRAYLATRDHRARPGLRRAVLRRGGQGSLGGTDRQGCVRRMQQWRS